MQIFRIMRAVGARNPTFGGLQPLKVGDPPPLAEKNLGAGTQKSSRTRLSHPWLSCIIPHAYKVGVRVSRI